MLVLVALIYCLVCTSYGLPTTKIVNKEKKSCVTVEGETCKFPFIYNGVKHFNCTWEDSPMPWCATETTKNGTVTPSKWGDCKVGSLSTCEVEPLEVPTCITATPLPGASVRIVNQPSEALGLSDLSCVFPFRYKDVTYTSCTTIDRGQPWCATATNSSGNFLPGSWGYCPPTCPSSCTPGSKWSSDACNSCTCSSEGKSVCSEQKSCSPPLPPSSSPSTRCLTESGPSKNTPCVLPFSFQGRTHTTCAPWTFGGEHEGKLWCSTKTSPLGVHVEGGGHYGFCSEGCGPNHAEINKGIRLDRPKTINQNIVFQNTLEPLLDYPN